jgi:hypothetical protein
MRLTVWPARIRFRPTANSKNNIPTVAATGPIFTREPMIFGISRLADTSRTKVVIQNELA